MSRPRAPTPQALIDVNQICGSATIAGDLNGDGNAGLAVADSSGVGVLLGKGDGTFLRKPRM
ncbi:MAG: VCBS repeat-containing protein [Polyangiaceae bacterium]